MAITFLEQRKRQKYLVPFLVAVLLLTGFVLLRGFFTTERPLPLSELPERPIKQVEINFAALEHPFLKELQPFEEIPAFTGEVGRKNPFILY